MRLKINKDGKESVYTMINSWDDVTLDKWVRLINNKNESKTEEAIHTINVLSDIPRKLVKELGINDVANILQRIAKMQEETSSKLKKIIKVNDIEYGFHPNLEEITLGEYADIETYLKNGIETNLPKLMSVLYRPIIEKDGSSYSIEAYGVSDMRMRAKKFEKMKAADVNNALVFFLDFRERTVNDFAAVFDGTESGDTQQSTDEQFADKWGWFGVMYRLTNGEIINLERITNLSLYECLTWLTYETDLNETKAVQK